MLRYAWTALLYASFSSFHLRRTVACVQNFMLDLCCLEVWKQTWSWNICNETYNWSLKCYFSSSFIMHVYYLKYKLKEFNAGQLIAGLQ